MANCGFLDLRWNGSADLDPCVVGARVRGPFGRHTYVVKAVDRSGNTSARSNEIVLDSGLSC